MRYYLVVCPVILIFIFISTAYATILPKEISGQKAISEKLVKDYIRVIDEANRRIEKAVSSANSIPVSDDSTNDASVTALLQSAQNIKNVEKHACDATGVPFEEYQEAKVRFSQVVQLQNLKRAEKGDNLQGLKSQFEKEMNAALDKREGQLRLKKEKAEEALKKVHAKEEKYYADIDARIVREQQRAERMEAKISDSDDDNKIAKYSLQVEKIKKKISALMLKRSSPYPKKVRAQKKQEKIDADLHKFYKYRETLVKTQKAEMTVPADEAARIQAKMASPPMVQAALDLPVFQQFKSELSILGAAGINGKNGGLAFINEPGH